MSFPLGYNTLSSFKKRGFNSQPDRRGTGNGDDDLQYQSDYNDDLA